MLSRATSSVLIGRADERAQLDLAFQSAVRRDAGDCDGCGRGRRGKVAARHRIRGPRSWEATVLTGACIDERVPYSPIADALRSLARSGWAPDDVCRGSCDGTGVAGAGARMAADGRPDSGAGSSESVQSAFVQLVEALGRQRPGRGRRGGSALVGHVNQESVDVRDAQRRATFACCCLSPIAPMTSPGATRSVRSSPRRRVSHRPRPWNSSVSTLPGSPTC